MAILDYIFIARATYIFCAFFFAPKFPALRLFNVDDTQANHICRRLVVVSLLAASGIFNEWLRELGVKQGEFKIGFWTNFAFFMSMIVAVYLSRKGIRQMLLHSGETNRHRQAFAKIWPGIVITCIALVWLLLEVVIANVGFDDDVVFAAIFTMLSIVALPFFDILIIAWVKSVYSLAQIENSQQLKLRKSLQQSAIRISRIIFLSLSLFFFSTLWGIDFLHFSSQGLAVTIIVRVIEAMSIMMLGYVIWEVIHAVIKHKLAKELPQSGEQAMDSEGGGGLSRAATLLPLIRNTFAFLIIVLSSISALSALGINTTALLAGAGVLGLAIGFGAQTLVKDIVSGVFFLVDDAFRMGEYVAIGTTMGTVEKIALRSLRLRHHLGALHTIPYGEIPSLTNYSRDWVIMKLRFRVPHDTDLNKVKKLFKKLGKELLEHPELGSDFLAPFKSQGVLEVDEIGMLIRGKFTCKPGAQFMIRKEVYLRVQQLFAANGIEFAKPKVEVALPDSSPFAAAKELGAAAAQSVQAQQIKTATT